MIFNTFNTNLFFVFQFGLTLFAYSPTASAGKQITLEEIYGELRNESLEFFPHHYGLMWTISGYLDNLYNVTKAVTERCSLTAGATQFMLEQLKITQETADIVTRSITAARNDILTVHPLEDHPLKFVCRRVAQAYGQKPQLSTAFSLAKIIVRNEPVRLRPAYSENLITSLATMGKLLDSWATIPELARAMANSGFRNQLNESNAYTTRHHLLVKSVFEIVHKDDDYAYQMQDVYEHMLTKLLPQITTNATAQTLTLPPEHKTFWFFPRMMRMFYKYLKEDTVLLKEIEDTAAVLGRGYDKTYIDFSLI